MIQYGLEPVIIQWILNGFEALLENGTLIFKSKAFL